MCVWGGGGSIQKLPFDVSILPRATAGCVVLSYTEEERVERKKGRRHTIQWGENLSEAANISAAHAPQHIAVLKLHNLPPHLTSPLTSPHLTSPLTSPSPHLPPFLLSTLLFLDFLNSWWILEVLLRFLSKDARLTRLLGRCFLNLLTHFLSSVWHIQTRLDPFWRLFTQLLKMNVFRCKQTNTMYQERQRRRRRKACKCK